MIARVFLLAVAVAALHGCGSCSGSRLSGDSSAEADADEGFELLPDENPDDPIVEDVVDVGEEEPSPVCGNGILEEGEECDSETRPCNEQGCGGGFQSCESDCTWGECIEDRMTVLAGPIVVSEGLVVHNGSGKSPSEIFLSDGRFKLFYRATVESGDDCCDAYHSTVEGNGALSGPPFLFTPSLLPLGPEGSMDNISAASIESMYPFAVLFELRQDPAHFNLVDGEGLAVMDPGIALWVAHNSYFLASSGDIIIAAFEYNYLGGISFLNSSGEIIGTDDLLYLDWTAVKNFEAVADADGFTVFMLDVRRELGGRERTFLMRSYDMTGNPLTEPIQIVERAFFDSDILSAAWTGSSYAVVFGEWKEDGIAELQLRVVDGAGEEIVPPAIVGNAWEMNFTESADLVWTGSELGVAYVDPVLPIPEPATQTQTVLRLARFSVEGTPIGDPVEVAAGYQSHAPSLVWNGSRYGVSWNEPLYPRSEGNLHFALVGCPE
jgi:hypothetical protein